MEVEEIRCEICGQDNEDGGADVSEEEDGEIKGEVEDRKQS